ncbi:MAG: hypothetical protein HYY06_15790 [Deltaproteobacteria bacterium]|nr:hypothetical protein [Deltaproteobacteria bacterium]
MPPVALLLLLPRVALLPPEAPEPLRETAEACASAFASSPALDTIRLEHAPGALGLANRVDPDLRAAAQAYRELRFRQASALLETVTALLETEATTTGDFELLFVARVRLGMALLAQRQRRAAEDAFGKAARLAADTTLQEGDYSPAVIAAFEEARSKVAQEPVHPLSLDVRSSVGGVVPTVVIDGRPATTPQVSLGAGAHVVQATAPGHAPVRLVVTLPRGEPLAVVLAPAATDLSGRVVAGLALAPTPGGARLTLRPAGQPEISEEATRGAEAEAARRLAAALGARLAPSAVPTVQTDPRPASAQVQAAYDWRATLDRPRPRSSGSVFGRWWFWTIVGGVTVVAVVGIAAAGKADPGTDVSVGLAE